MALHRTITFQRAGSLAHPVSLVLMTFDRIITVLDFVYARSGQCFTLTGHRKLPGKIPPGTTFVRKAKSRN
jgi:hypothetical protein